MYFDLFDTLISPILSYGCEVWGLCAADVIEKVSDIWNVFWVLNLVHQTILYMVILEDFLSLFLDNTELSSFGLT